MAAVKLTSISGHVEAIYICHECHKSRQREYYHANKERLQQHNRAWKERNKERYLAKAREYAANNVDKYKEYSRQPKSKFTSARYKAIRRGVKWDLTLEEFESIACNAVCEYCQGPLPEFGSGIDRKDNSKGYTSENSVPCCWTCNKAKSTEFSYEEMLIVGKAVREIRLRRNEQLNGVSA